MVMCLSGLVACSSKSYVETSDGLTERKINQSQAAQSRLTLALKYIELKSYQDAKVNLDKAMNYDAENAAVYLGYAYYYQRVNESKQAESAYLKARELAPKDGNIRNNYGTFLCAQQKYAAHCAKDMKMDGLIWSGAAISCLGLVGLILSIIKVNRARKAGLNDEELRAAVQKVLPLNLGSLFLSVIGLMMVIVGIFLG